MKMKTVKIYKIDGVGIDLRRFQPCWDEQLRVMRRKSFGFSETDFIVTVIAELNKNKNQIALIKAIPLLRTRIPQLKILLIGKETEANVHRYVDEHSLNDIVMFLGYRNDDFKILYAPTWRKQADVWLFPFDDVDFQDLEKILAENNITIYIRLHPSFNEVGINKSILSPHIKLFSTEECKEIMDVLSLFDALITDYSSILYDFMLLNRPLIFLPYDYEEYENKIGFAVDYETITPGYKPKSCLEFKEAVLDAKYNDSYKSIREDVCSICNKFRDGSSDRLLTVLKSLNVKGL